MIYIRFLQTLWKSRGSRVFLSLCILLILSSIVFKSLDGVQYFTLTECLGNLGFGGGAILFGINMLRFFLPEDLSPRLRGQWRGQAVLLIAGGVVALISAWMHCTSICFPR